ncbi:olfactory receptor 6N2-like [Bombina bombina]|uniref:olfactory receptor 6N2-like n=1 Tax=Bombina bombina TaxID=8345 RepID=UPI00235B20C5|nr:olfactory receptor 6N2-like [Bombina bombina]
MTKEFILLGASSLSIIKIWVTPALLLAYSFTVVENIVLIALVTVDSCLHTPMYFFLGHFSFLECLYTTTVIPRTLYHLISDNKVILFSTCIFQIYIFISLGATECLLLATMAYDRYAAICYPLHYSTLMKHQLCRLLVFWSWIGGFLSPLLPSVFVSQLCFCSNIINHFFCDIAPLLQLSCLRASHIELSGSLISSAILISSFIVIAVSYIQIIRGIFIMTSKTGLKKTFSTCISHFTVVCIYYGSGIYMYVRPNSQETLETNKLVSLLYAVMTPMLNPIIYSFRNNDVIKAFNRFLKRKC